MTVFVTGNADNKVLLQLHGVFVTGHVDNNYDLVVIGGGSGGLACSKEGTNSLIQQSVDYGTWQW